MERFRGRRRLAYAYRGDTYSRCRVSQTPSFNPLKEAAMAPSPEPFQLSIPETALADLKARLAMTRFPDQAPDGPWAGGTDLE